MQRAACEFLETYRLPRRSNEGSPLRVRARDGEMKKKQDETEQDLENDLASSVFSRPARSSASTRKGASHSSSKRKGPKATRRKGNTTGGIHQRGDKKVIR